MAASATDYFTKASSGTRPVPTTLSGTKIIGASSISCAALTGWPTDTGVYFCIYTTDTSGAKVAGSQTEWVGTVSGTTISNLTPKAGTDNGYSIGAIVEAAPLAGWADALATGILVGHNQTGLHKAFTETAIIPTAAIQDGAVTYLKVATGVPVQVIDNPTSAFLSGTTIIPADDTAPQSTEGDQYMSVTITPKSTTNKLYIEGVALLAGSAANNTFAAAVFQDSGTSAVATGSLFQATASTLTPVPFYYSMTAGTTSATTFKLRCGSNQAGTTSFNGAGARFYGTTIKSWMKVTEVKA